MAKKIMFNDSYGLTQAVLDGRKTMTRRLVPEGTPCGCWRETVKRSRYQVGEVVAIAQSYKDAGYSEKEVFAGWTFSRAGWNNKLFVAAGKMLHHIRITDVKVERLNDITPDDCLKEGIICKCHAPACRNYYYVPNETINHPDKVHETPQEAFAALIDKVSGKGVWDSNPYVFVYEFELLT